MCDCLGYRSAKLCAHALAVAESCGLFDYLSWYKQLKCKPSVGYLANLSKPKMCGNVPSSLADSQYLGTASHTSVQRGQSNYHPTSQYTPVRGGNLSYPPQLGPPYSPGASFGLHSTSHLQPLMQQSPHMNVFDSSRAPQSFPLEHQVSLPSYPVFKAS